MHLASETAKDQKIIGDTDAYKQRVIGLIRSQMNIWYDRDVSEGQVKQMKGSTQSSVLVFGTKLKQNEDESEISQHDNPMDHWI